MNGPIIQNKRKVTILQLCPYAGSECAVVGDIPLLVVHLRDDHYVEHAPEIATVEPA